jgi:hypothetical protein
VEEEMFARLYFFLEVVLIRAIAFRDGLPPQRSIEKATHSLGTGLT